MVSKTDISLILPDGSSRTMPAGSTGADLAASISPRLAREALAVRVDGAMQDLAQPLPDGAHVEILTADNPEGLQVMRHSCAHLMAQAIRRLHPEAQFEDGPATEDGFWYDVKTDKPIGPEDFQAIEEEMRKIVKERLPVSRRELGRGDALRYFKDRGQDFKLGIIAEIPEGDTISVYEQGDFSDLCRGPHVPNTGVFKAYKLTTAAGAYLKGDSNNVQLTRVRGLCFSSKKELEEYEKLLEEARRRDHRRLGRELELFMFHEWAPGEAFWLPKGKTLYDVLRTKTSTLHLNEGYQEVFTPMLFKKDLFETSGHWQNFREDMFILDCEETQYCLKPMNCPSHMLIFREKKKSYRELPLRIFDMGVLHRNEASGTLSGLTRVRQFCQDDSHIFLTADMIAEEITRVISMVRRVYATIEMEFGAIYLSTRPQEKFLGTVEQWNKAEAALEEALKANKMDYEIAPGDGAFYGPKIDFIVRDALRRDWQTATIQLDSQLPMRFELSYVDADNSEKTPIVVHRALFGSFERFMGILIEHFAGAFPFWLAPEQVRVMTISEKFVDYGRKALAELQQAGIRATLDDRDDKISYKIREGQLMKVPVMLVCGQKEVDSQTIAVRTREDGDKGAWPLEKVVDYLKSENQVEF